jgi:hypothetical protein
MRPVRSASGNNASGSEGNTSSTRAKTGRFLTDLATHPAQLGDLSWHMLA